MESVTSGGPLVAPDREVREDAETMRIVAMLRWGGVILGAGEGFLITSPRPIGGPWILLGFALFMAAYNVVAANARRLSPLVVQRALPVFLGFDLLVCGAWTFLVVNDMHSTAYVVYVLVGMEAAFVYGLRGSVVMAALVVAAISVMYVLRTVAYGFPLMLSSIVFRTLILVATSLFAGAIVDQSRRNSRRAVSAGAVANKAAQELVSLLRAISEMGEGVVVVQGGPIVEANDAFLELSGYTLEELKRVESFYDLLPEHPRREVGPDGRILLLNLSGDAKLLHKGGELIPIDWAARMIETPDGVQMVAVVRDARGRMSVMAQLEEARNIAERATHAKSEYLSRMSHELRTPLTAILGFAELLAIEDPRADQMSAIDAVSRSGAHLRALIDDVLDISRIESGGYDMELEAVDVLEAVSEATKLMSALADARGITVITPTPDDGAPLIVLADRQALTQVLVNLVSNAIKYNVEGGRVEVTVTAAAHRRLLVRVSDTGQGIPGDRLESIFEPFQRLNAQRRDVEGTGLGLALVRQLTAAMNGSVTVTSIAGEGSTFTVDLPGTSPAAMAPVDQTVVAQTGARGHDATEADPV